MSSVTGMRIHTAVAALALTAGVVAGTTVPASLAATASPAPVSPPVPVLNWASCYHEFQCATARVPLDYRHPAGTKISPVRHHRLRPARLRGQRSAAVLPRPRRGEQAARPARRHTVPGHRAAGRGLGADVGRLRRAVRQARRPCAVPTTAPR